MDAAASQPLLVLNAHGVHQLLLLPAAARVGAAASQLLPVSASVPRQASHLPRSTFDPHGAAVHQPLLPQPLSSAPFSDHNGNAELGHTALCWMFVFPHGTQ